MTTIANLDVIAGVLRRDLDLPPGYSVEVDRKTRNIVVKNDRLGFAVTGRWLLDHRDSYIGPIAEQLEALKRATGPVTTPLGDISTAKQIAAERDGGTAFD